MTGMWQLAMTIALQLLGVVLEWYKASNDTKLVYLNLINSIKNDGLISVAAHDEFQKQKDKLNAKNPT